MNYALLRCHDIWISSISVLELRGDLILTLVERWWLETHNFYLLCGECTITLKDVAMQLGLLVDGDAVIGSSGIANLAALYYDLLGRSPSDVICKVPIPTAEFVWMLYIAPDVASFIPPSTRAHAIMWCVNAPIINFQMAEWYARDWVLCPFGCRQHAPDVPIQLGKDVHGIDKKGKHAKNWALEHQPYIVLWNAQLERRPYLESCFPNFTPSRDYQQWYVRNGLP
ncbi:hypothetical protein PVK06_034463 [Gossypium arboreum]|uniref:Aminotransferase-like plant mobile domain-containing protein n=1 Tax=Gossypium arboreum TaxID=29729 RepID=A0ABR0NGD3_GOSAR|nr:hypothetical protein PVK06_034463 [Gossypium arboreum]